MHDQHDRDHINAFIDLNGVPYLLGEYLDRNSFRQIDGSYLRNEINIIEEEMRAIVEISIDDIGRRNDGYPNIIGNTSKVKDLVNAVYKYAHKFEHRLDILRGGLILVIDYQLENVRTRQIIRSAKETIRIPHRSYFLNINPRDINDNAIIINFYEHLTSTINQFTHGTDHMVLRLTNVHMFYECAKRAFMDTPYTQDPFHPGFPVPPKHLHNGPYHPNDGYYFQKNEEHSDPIDLEDYAPHYHGHPKDNIPPCWEQFNKYYHFENTGSSIDIHLDELYDTNTKTFLIPCGVIHMNRTFMINPGHKIVFKINVWKNDLVSVKDTREIKHALETDPHKKHWNGRYDMDHHNDYPDYRYDPEFRHHHKEDEIHKLWEAIFAVANGRYLSDPGCCPEPGHHPPHHPPHHPKHPGHDHLPGEVPDVDFPGWKVSLYGNGGLLDGNKEKLNLYIKSGIIGDIIPEPVWAGKVFDSWKLIDLATGKMTDVELNENTAVVTRLIAIATWVDVDTPSVVFDANGGKVEDEKIYLVDSLYDDQPIGNAMPENPKFKDHTFKKWIAGITEFTSDSIPDTNMVVFAEWDNKDPYDDARPHHPVHHVPPHLEIPINKYEIHQMLERLFG